MGPRPRRRATLAAASRSAPGGPMRIALGSAVVLTAALALTGCFGSGAEQTDRGEGDFAADGCTHIAVATSSEKVNMLDALAAAFKDSPEAKALDTCASVRPVNV